MMVKIHGHLTKRGLHQAVHDHLSDVRLITSVNTWRTLAYKPGEHLANTWRTLEARRCGQNDAPFLTAVTRYRQDIVFL